jgi:hypothetical protein
MKSRSLGTLAVLAVTLLVVLASTAGGTAANFGDDERVNVTFATQGDEVVAFSTATVVEPELTVSLQNGRSADRWEDGISYGPPDYRTGVLVITSQDDLKLEITSDSPEPLVFEIEAELIARALEVDDLRGVTATLDGRPLEYEIVYLSGADHVVFRIDHFSTRYVVFAETMVVPDEPLPADNSSGNETTAMPDEPVDEPVGEPVDEPVDDGPPTAPPGNSGDAPGQNKNGKHTGTDRTVSDDTVTTTQTPEPTPEPVTTVDSTPEPVTTPEPVSTPEPTPEPVTTDDPTPELVTTDDSTPEPTTVDDSTPEPVTTDDPTPEPVTTDDSTPEPTTVDDSTPEPVTTDDSTPDPTTTDSGSTVADGR